MGTASRHGARRRIRRIAFGILRVFVVAALTGAGLADAAGLVRNAAGTDDDDDDERAEGDSEADDAEGAARIVPARIALSCARDELLSRPPGPRVDAALLAVTAANEALSIATVRRPSDAHWQELIDDVTVASQAAHAARGPHRSTDPPVLPPALGPRHT